jgi:hypothetical protein
MCPRYLLNNGKENGVVIEGYIRDKKCITCHFLYVYVLYVTTTGTSEVRCLLLKLQILHVNLFANVQRQPC